MSSSSAAALEELYAVISEDRHVTYAYASALTFVMYDIILSFGQEIRYIWGSKWTVVKGLYLMVRYYALINLIPMVALFTRVNSELSERVCKNYFLWSIISGSPIFAVTVDLILMLRVWALYGRSRTLLTVFLVLVFGSFAAAFWAATMYALGLAANVFTPPYPWQGCASINPRLNSVLLVYIPNVVLSFLFLAMTLRKLVQNQELYGKGVWESLRNMKIMSPLLHSFFRDGSMLFALVCLANLLGMLGAFILQGVLSASYYPWTLALYSYAGAHLILNLRAAGAEDGSRSLNTVPSLYYNSDQSVSRGITFS